MSIMKENNIKDQQEEEQQQQQKDETTTTMSSSPVAKSVNKPSFWQQRKELIFTILLILPYIIGIAWTCLHPVLSIMTGEAKCRGSYIDENALEVNLFRSPIPPTLPATTTRFRTKPFSYCQQLMPQHSSVMGGDDEHQTNIMRRDNIECFQTTMTVKKNNNQSFISKHEVDWEVLKVEPTSNAIVPRQESILLVLPPISCNQQEQRQIAGTIIHILKHHLVSFHPPPWLAKTILILAPLGNCPLEEDDLHHDSSSRFATTSPILASVLSDFWRAYHAPYPSTCHINETASASFPYGHQETILPPEFKTTIIRNLLVLDVRKEETITTTPHLRILSQGPWGLLPNMDLVFAATRAFSGYGTGTFGDIIMHSQPQTTSSFEFLSRLVSSRWFEDMQQYFAFLKTMAVGPYGPHAVVMMPKATKSQSSIVGPHLVDALTLELTLPTTSITTVNIKALVKYLDITLLILVRALNNLHERLHHSITQYILIGRDKFVSQTEYLIPNLLLLVPLIVRAVYIIFLSDKHRQPESPDIFRAFGLWGQIFALTIGLHIASQRLLQSHVHEDLDKRKKMETLLMTLLFAIVYIGFVGQIIVDGVISKDKMKNRRPDDTTLQTSFYSHYSFRFTICLVTLYGMIPLTLFHMPWAFPTCLIWTPLIGIFGYYESTLQNDKDNENDDDVLSPSNGSGKWLAFRMVIGIFSVLILGLWLVVTWPPVVLLALIELTPMMYNYLIWIHFPLHMAMSIFLVMITILR